MKNGLKPTYPAGFLRKTAGSDKSDQNPHENHVVPPPSSARHHGELRPTITQNKGKTKNKGEVEITSHQCQAMNFDRTNDLERWP